MGNPPANDLETTSWGKKRHEYIPHNKGIAEVKGFVESPTIDEFKTPSKGDYIPPHLRHSNSSKDIPRYKRDTTRLRVSNISSDTTDGELKDLFGIHARDARVRTNESGSYGLVEFTNLEEAQRQQKLMNGRGYKNLIL